MKSAGEIERSAKKLRFRPNAAVNERIIACARAALKKSVKAKSAGSAPGIRRTIVRSRITKIAAAAVIIVAVGFFVIHRDSNEKIDSHRAPDVSKSPIEMMTVASLNIAYQRGGMDAVEEQCDKVCEMLGTQPAGISLEELMAGFNGT